MRENFGVYYQGFDIGLMGGCPSSMKQEFWKGSPWKALSALFGKN